VTDHVIEPHYAPGGHDKGDWFCETFLDDAKKVRCGRRLAGSYLRPVIPWRHADDPIEPRDQTVLPGLGTTE
jgi:hypothetical protein